MVKENLDFFLQTSIQDWTTMFLKLLCTIRLTWLKVFILPWGPWRLQWLDPRITTISEPWLNQIPGYWQWPLHLDLVHFSQTVLKIISQFNSECSEYASSVVLLVSCKYQQGKMESHVFKNLCEPMETHFPLK